MKKVGNPGALILVFGAIGILADSPFLAGEGDKRLRSEVLKELAQAETAFHQSPASVDLRKKYAALLFQTGDFRKAGEVVGPLVKMSSPDIDVLSLGARLAYLAAEYKSAEKAYQRILDVAAKNPKEYAEAVRGLALTYFQTHEYSKVKRLPDVPDLRPFLEMMKKFPERPYRIEWTNKEKTATVPYAVEGMLPTVPVMVNGKPLKFILDTGGNLFYIDKKIAEEVGLEKLAAQKAAYAYTDGQEVEEFLGRAESVTLGEVTIRNVPFTLAEWKSRGILSDGVITTQVLKEFLFTIDYADKKMIFRERSDNGRKQYEASIKGKDTVDIPFVLDSTHLMFARGSLNGVEGLTFLVDSGLAATVPFVAQDELLRDMKLETKKLEGTKYSLFEISSLGLGRLVQDQPTQGLAGVLLSENSYWSRGFIWDGLISHQFLKNSNSWTIDFDAMKFIFVR
jgi:tetratricopeptide (TPR) repeat protein